MDKSKIKPLFGLLGVLVAAISAEFNDQVASIALPDVLGGLSLSHDPGTWVDSLYVSAEIIGLCISPWLFITFTVRRFALFVIALNCIVTLLIPFSPNAAAVYVLRSLQGLAGGMTVPILLAAALKGLPVAIRLYGLAIYALTATFTPNFAATLAALWTGAVGWQFTYFEALPFCAVAGLLVWWGFPQDEPKYERFRVFDWRGALGLTIGFGAFSTMLQQGDRLDWFDSPFISILALTSAVVQPLVLVNEWFHPLPFLKLQLLLRRNVAYGVVALFLFLIIGSSSSLLPTDYLVRVQGFRPIQVYQITLVIALSQLVLLPATSFLLDFEWADARTVSFGGLVLGLAACVGNSFITLSWQRGAFYLWQALQAVGQPLIVVPLLMLTTNAITNPEEEAPFASALVNTTRGLAEAVGAWLIMLIQRWRGALHSDRLVDQAGLDRFRLSQGSGQLPDGLYPLLSNGQPRAPGSLEAFGQAVEQQAAILTAADTYLIIGGIVVVLIVILIALPQKTVPPRLLPHHH